MLSVSPAADAWRAAFHNCLAKRYSVPPSGRWEAQAAGQKPASDSHAGGQQVVVGRHLQLQVAHSAGWQDTQVQRARICGGQYTRAEGIKHLWGVGAVRKGRGNGVAEGEGPST